MNLKVLFNRGYVCCGCERRISKDGAYSVYKNTCLCDTCFNKFLKTGGNGMFEGTPNVPTLVAPYWYKDLYRQIFLRFKFGDNKAYGIMLANAVAELLAENEELKGYDCIVPVPLSKQRLNERGFNQAEIMAGCISERLGTPVVNLLVRNKHCEAQSTLTAVNRAKNVINAFSTNGEVRGKKIILFDDVFTTGSTVNECARVLKNAGAEKLIAVCSAKADIDTKSGKVRYRF